MPLHNWQRVPAGLFHHFHQDWSIEVARELNRGRLPKGLSALVEQRAGGHEPDVLTIENLGQPLREGADGNGGVATMSPPSTQIVRHSTAEIYAKKANHIVIRHHLGRIVAVIEIVSPGNKDRRGSVREFVEKAVEYLHAGIHVLIVDLFPPTPRDPCGMHKAIWDEITEEDFTFPPGKDRILAAYRANRGHYSAYVEPIAVGDELPDMPIFLASDFHVPVPLGPTYQAAWEASPEELRVAVESGILPQPDAE